MLLILGYVTGAIAAALVAYSLSGEYQRFARRNAASQLDTSSTGANQLKVLLSPVGVFLHRHQTDSDFVRKKAIEYRKLLAQSGEFWGGFNEYEIIAAKLVIPVLVMAFLMFAGFAVGVNPGIVFLVSMLFAFGSFVLPDSVLHEQAKTRKTLFLRQLPGALDVLKIAAEAGLDFHSSVGYLVDIYVPGPVREEMRIFQRELRLGVPTVDGLINISQRMDVPEASSIIVSLAQSIEMGTSIVAMLESSSAEMRQKRLLNAESEAQKAVVKITFPLLLLILPGVFIVLLAPMATPMLKLFANIGN